ncbi:cycle protein 16 homolog [Seminavis robusta]|uniref:Cycle protein 16 homolog n=1 Tax=Seminavis robusta TaxID=568900 RepID=A0A9N8HH75_9STRA|nr:cycle protein 16 homolog [Seminavis robusta]|eukprot:Sro434_g142110.1 cycle protein 16 homolog (913) ;mRNA; r:43237-46055
MTEPTPTSSNNNNNNAGDSSLESPNFVSGAAGQNLFPIDPSPASQSTTQWSPAGGGAQSASRRPPRRFFEAGGDGSTTTRRLKHPTDQQQQHAHWAKEKYLSSFPTGPTSSTTTTGSIRGNPNEEMTDDNVMATSNDKSVIIDGIDTKVLRTMTKNALGTASHSPLPSTAVFYASLLYSKTNSLQDCFLYAQTLSRNGESKRCVRLLEEAGLLDHPGIAPTTINNKSPSLYLEAVLLAAEALSALVEWQSVLELLEDACHSWGSNESAHAALGAPQPLEDEDDFAWQSLFQRHEHSEGYLHPVSRLCLWRGRAYAETGHPQRAALYWKRAIQMDPKCVQALDFLLERSVVTPREAFEIIQSLTMDESMEWLRLMYLARIDLSPQDGLGGTTTEDAAQQQQSIDVHNLSSLSRGMTPKSAFGMMNEDHPYLDASSIQLASPFMLATPNGNPVTSTMAMAGSNLRGILSTGGGNKSNAAVHFDYSTTVDNNAGRDEEQEKMATATTKGKSTIQQSVDDAFAKLWHVHKLDQSPEVLAMAARRAYRRYDLKSALAHCQHLASIDPLCQAAGYVYIATLAALGHKRHLFRLAHEWVAASPKSARAWFAVGSYYYCCERFHVAQRHFCRATRLDPHCTEAWIAFGCSFAACDESDQALASFRAAQRISPGEYASFLYMGIEYLRTNHLVLAQYFLNAACKASGGDPLCLNELGVLAMHRSDYTSAIRWFSRGLGACVHTDGQQHQQRKSVAESIQLCQEKHWEATIFNLGQCYRKTRQFSKAAHCFERCIALSPENCSGYAALGFTKHLMGNLDEAIDSYHQALGCKPEDPFSTEMLNKALQEVLSATFSSSEDENTLPKHHNLHPGNSSNTPCRFGNDTATDHDQISLSKDYTGTSMLSDDGANLSVESDVDMSLA